MSQVKVTLNGMYNGSPKIYSLAPDGTELFSSIRKEKIESAYFTFDGISEDVQFEDIAIHGGPDRAILHYCTDDYEFLKSKIDVFHKANNVVHKLPRDEKYQSPSFGENISSSGDMNARSVCIGDIYRVGGALVQVTQPRKPCLKLNHVFEYPMFSVFAEENACSGWFYRVLEEGKVSVGDEIVLVERLNPDISVSQVNRLTWDDTLTESELNAMIQCEEVPDKWKSFAKTYLEKSYPGRAFPRLIGTDKAFLSSAQLKRKNKGLLYSGIKIVLILILSYLLFK